MASKILLIHDSQTTVESLQELFKNLVFEIIVEGTPEAGLQLMRSTTINGLLLDLDMLEMGGIQMLQGMQEELLLVPTIVIGSSGTQHLLITALTKGANDYLLKPISIDEMYGKCLRLFS